MVGAAHQPTTRSGRGTPADDISWSISSCSAGPAPRPYGAGQCGASNPRFGQRRLALVVGQRGDPGDRVGDLGSQVGDLAQVDAEIAADAGLSQLGGPAQPARGPAEELPDPVGPTEVQVRVVLPGDPDSAEHLNAVLDVGLRGLDPDARGDSRGNGQLAVIAVSCGAGSIGGGHRHLLGAAQHLGAQVLDRLEAADRLAELLTHLGVGDGGIQRPSGDSRRFGGQHSRGQVRHPVRGGVQHTGRRRGQLHPRQWPGEVGGLQWLNCHPAGGGVNE